MICPICNKRLDRFDFATCKRYICEYKKKYIVYGSINYESHYDLTRYNDGRRFFLRYIIAPFLIITKNNFSSIYIEENEKPIDVNFELLLSEDNLENIRAKLKCYLTFR
jgi:hypothetical protein